MKAKLLSVAVALLALWAVPSAFADSGGSGGFQAGAQSASTNQAALGAAASYQNAVNANVPVSIAGGNVTSGPSSATSDGHVECDYRRLEQGQDRSGPASEPEHRRQLRLLRRLWRCGWIPGRSPERRHQPAGGRRRREQPERSQCQRPGFDRGRQRELRPELGVAERELLGLDRRLEQGEDRPGPVAAPEHRRRFVQARLWRRGRIPGRDPGRPDQPAGCRDREERPERRERERARLDRRWERLLRPEQRDADGDVERVRRRLEQGEDRPGSAPQPEHRRGLVPGRLRRPGRLPGRRPERRDQSGRSRDREERPERRERERARLDRRWERLLRPEQRDADGDVERLRRRLEQGEDRPGPVAAPEHRRPLVRL